MASGKFKINGTLSATGGFDATHGQVLIFTLEDALATDVDLAEYRQVAKTKDAPDLFVGTITPSPPTSSEVLTAPGSGIHSWEIECKVDQGVNKDGVIVPEYTFRRIISIRGTSSGSRKIVPGETVQYDGTNGWSGAQNENVDELEALAGGIGGDVPTTRQVIAGAGLTGGGDLSANRTLNVVANADASIIVNADDVQIGVLASDAQHGNRGGGAIHTPAVAGGANGFLTGVDKAAIDDLSSGTVTKVNGATLTPSVGGGVINACTGAGAVVPAASSWIGKQVSVVLDGVAGCVITSADASDRFYTAAGAGATSYTCAGASSLIYRGANKILAYP